MERRSRKKYLRNSKVARTVLRNLRDGAKRNLQEIANLIGYTETGVLFAVRALENYGLVKSKRVGKARLVWITDKGGEIKMKRKHKTHRWYERKTQVAMKVPMFRKAEMPMFREVEFPELFPRAHIPHGLDSLELLKRISQLFPEMSVAELIQFTEDIIETKRRRELKTKTIRQPIQAPDMLAPRREAPKIRIE